MNRQATIRSFMAVVLLIASSSLFSSCASNQAEVPAETPDAVTVREEPPVLVEVPQDRSPASSREPTSASPRTPAAFDVPAPYDETIPGSAVLIHLVPVVTDASTGRGFWMSTTEVTWEAFDGWIYGLSGEAAAHDVDGLTRPSKPYVPPDRGWGHDGFPAGSMTFASANGFCEWLSKVVGRTYRLPTEAEWELACGQGAASAEDLDDVAWFWDNADDRTHPVGQKVPNAFGLHDMLGNVAEWCTAPDGGGVARGGSFIDEADECTPTSRAEQQSSWNVSDPQIPKSAWWLPDAPFVGIRLVRDFASN